MPISGHDEMRVGMGLPGAEKELLSVDEEKSIDEHGQKVVSKLPWSKVSTGLYMTLFVALVAAPDGEAYGKAFCDREMCGDRTLVGPNHQLLICGTRGKPKFNLAGWGASLEMPSDLASDSLKKQYVTEWLVHTLTELLGVSGSRHSGSPEFALWVCATADAAIAGTGL